MATKRPQSGNPSSAATSDASGVRVTIEATDVDPIYANYMDVAHGQYEFALSVARIPVKLKPEAIEAARAAGVLSLEPIVQIIFPPSLVPGLIRALDVQKAKYEAVFGKMPTGEPDQ